MRYFLLTLLSLFTLNTSMIAQHSYTMNYVENMGNPGGLNVETDALISGWTSILNASNTSASQWSSTYTLPFSFQFYGVNYSAVKASTNAVLTFSTSTSGTLPNNENLPSTALPNNSICAFWEEFTVNPPMGFNDEIFVKTFGTAPNRQVWFKWNSFELGSSSYNYFSIVLEESTNKVYIVDMNYTSAGVTGTVGLQKDGTTAVQWGDTTMTYNFGSSSGADNDYYEFTPIFIVSDDVGISKVDNPKAIGIGTQNIEVTLKNYGNNALTSTTIEWEVNGVSQTPFSWTGNLNSLDSIENILIGNYNFVNNSNTLKVWTSMPNGVLDNQNNNDTTSISSACIAYQGLFTVANSGGDFSSVSEAIDSLTYCGIAGPVTILIADTTFMEEIVIPEIAGLSATNTLTFKGMDRDLTILRNIPGNNSSEKTTIHIDGADYVRFENLTIYLRFAKTTSDGVLIENDADHITFENCKFKIYTGSSISSVGTNALTNDYLTINNCFFDGGFVGLSGNNKYNEHNTISNCIFKSEATYGVQVTYQKDFVFYNNTMDELVYSPHLTALDLQYCINPDIRRNLIRNDTGNGIELFNINDTVTTPVGRGNIINNIIRCTGNFAAVEILEGKHLNIYNNTIYAWRWGMRFINNFDSIDLRNNIIVSETHPVIQTNDNTLFFANVSADNNIYYRQGGTSNSLFSFGWLSIWTSNAPASNANSIVGMPPFVDVTNHNYHVLPGITVDNGDTTLGVTIDFDGDARPMPTTNIIDIGADEITNYPLDLSVVSLEEPIPPIVVGTSDFKVKITNLGSSTVTNATIHWSINGIVQPSIAWSGSLASAQTTNAILIGNGNLGYGENLIQVWTFQPNGSTDGNIYNDTLTTSICSPYRGTFTVGTFTSDFLSLQEAVDRLEYCGIDSTVHLIIEADTLYGNTLIGEIPGRSSTNRVIIDGVHKDSTYLLCDSDCSDDGIIKILKGDYITVQNLTLYSRLSTSASGFEVDNGANYNTLKDCRVYYENYSNNASGLVGVVTDDDIEHFLMENNEITNWYYGMRMYQASGLNYSKANIIKNNIFKDNSEYGIRSVNQDSLQIIGNQFSGFDDPSSNAAAIYIYRATRLNIEGNHIEHPEHSIYLDEINHTSMLVLGRGRVVNNIIAVNDQYYATGLELRLCTGVDIFHNTINMQYGNAFKAEFNNYLDVRNNIFATNSGPALESIYTINNTNHFDYNTYFNENDTSYLVSYGLGANSVSYNLSGWQQQFPAWDVHSVVGDPVFVDRLGGDLHVLGNVPYDSGDSTVGVLVDYDGEIRPQGANVDMGADEYLQRDNDAILVNLLSPVDENCGSDSIQPIIVFRNIGTVSIDTMQFLAILSDDMGQILDSVTTTYYGNLVFTEYDTIALEYLDYRTGGDVIFTIIAQLENDQVSSNDTLIAQRYLLNGAAIVAHGDTICSGEDAIIVGEPANDYFDYVEYGVYDAPTGGNLLAYGDTVVVPNITTNQTVYADIYGVRQDIGYNKNSYPSLYQNTDTATMRFKLFVPTRIDTVSVNPKFGGNTVINIRDAQGNLVHTVTQAMPSSNSIYANTPVAINATLPPGSYSMDLAGSTASQFRYHSGAVYYPFTIPGMMEITWSGSQTSWQTFYYYFYDWKVTTYAPVCERPRTPVDITVLPTPIINNISIDSVDCFGGNNGSISIDMNGIDSLFTYHWSNGNTLSSASNLSSGYITVNVFDSLGCGLATGDTTIFLPQPSDILTSFNYTIIGCDSALITPNISGGTGNFNINWFNGDTSSTFLITADGNYSLTIMDANACVDSLSTSFVFPFELALTASSTPDTAETGVGTATVTPTGGIPPFTYQWNDALMQTTQTAVDLSKGTYICEVTDSAGCTDTISVNVEFPINTYNNASLNNIQLFPNPTSNFVNITIQTRKTEQIEISIFAIDGKKVYNQRFDNQININKTIDISSFSQGIYLVQFIIGEEVITKRLVISRE